MLQTLSFTAMYCRTNEPYCDCLSSGLIRTLWKSSTPTIPKASSSANIGHCLSSKSLRSQVGFYGIRIVCALLHIHNLGIAHADVRIDNILFDHESHALLCDFSASSPFGHPNPAYPHPDLPVPINGLSEIVSDATDRFAIGSLIF